MTRTAPFSKAAIRNAVLAGLFAVPPVGLVGLAAIGAAVGGTDTKTVAAKPAAKSDYDKCLEYKKQWPNAYDCDGIKNFRSPAELVRLAKNQQLGYKCKAALQASLKDPQSYRELDRRYVVPGQNKVNVVLTYSATNSFGGRVQSTRTCAYTL